jgi:hypothetical protein
VGRRKAAVIQTPKRALASDSLYLAKEERNPVEVVLESTREPTPEEGREVIRAICALNQKGALPHGVAEVVFRDVVAATVTTKILRLFDGAFEQTTPARRRRTRGFRALLEG